MNFFRPGSHYFICDVCGQKYHAEQKRIRWDNLVVCPDDFEMRHPQDFLRAREDRQAVPNPRPRPSDVFIPVNWTQTLTDAFNLLDSVVVDVHTALSDTTTMADMLGIHVTNALADSSVITDSLVNQTTYNKTLADNITLTDAIIYISGQTLNGSPINTYTIG